MINKLIFFSKNVCCRFYLLSPFSRRTCFKTSPVLSSLVLDNLCTFFIKKTQRVSFIRYLLQDFLTSECYLQFIIFNFQCICCLLMFCRTEISVIQSQFLEAFHNSFISLNLAIKQHILEDIRKELREYYNAMVSFMIDFYSRLHLILLRNMAIPQLAYIFCFLLCC